MQIRHEAVKRFVIEGTEWEIIKIRVSGLLIA
jgi:hypothetical protein